MRNIFGQIFFQQLTLWFFVLTSTQLFGLEWEWYDPLYPNAEQVETFSSRNWVIGEPTEKVKVLTHVFYMIVLMQMFNLVNVRNTRNNDFRSFSCKNKTYLILLILYFMVSLGLTIIMVQFGGRVMRCAPLDAMEHLTCILLSLCPTVIS